MKKVIFLLASVLLLTGCIKGKNNDSNSNLLDTSESDPSIVLNMNNYSLYIDVEKQTGFTGAAGFSPYVSWVVFSGVLSNCIYDANVTYQLTSNQNKYLGSFKIQLNAAGCATTETFDRLTTFTVTSVSGTIHFYN